MAKVSRDPFARTELHKRRVYTHHTCDWCGSFKNARDGERFLFEYRTETDGGTVSTHGGKFCSIGCHNDYHMR